ncbi:uncharacterized protein DSM5745_04566 [Aspergillus mulundensis]|uniref:non-specific serine/threonine protein kinase n=1 Tax=Aspergillus mulundensis TaxID=1810919 RepID=A0A3D8S3Z2_9EURO|nr:Uncharacterized protein DSM5745_04566 [Aspergillus mulundensis]RDW81009.1 Uncharacterized protein DSM5745_04566 [Aspergillus mulundensis]
MASVHSIHIEETPPRRTTRAPSTRAPGTRKVYGKRRTAAPRAVFEERSPAKPLEIANTDVVHDAVNAIQTKLASIQIDERKFLKDGLKDRKENIHEVTASEACEITTNETSMSKLKPPAEPAPTRRSQLKVTPVPKKRFQTMVEVRVTPRVIPKNAQDPVQETLREASAVLDSCKKSTRKNKPLQRPSSEYVQNEKATSYVRSILDETLSPAAAQGIQKFESWAARAGEMLEVVKLAEGSYGEVYKLRLREDVCQKEMSKSKLARLKACGDGVFKVVPLRAQSGPGSKKFTSIEEIVAEVKMLKYLDPIPGFARFREIHVVEGRFPAAFQKAWDIYKKTKDDCLNPNPSSKRAYPDSQIWAIIEMDDAGCELEKFSWSSIFQVYDIFWGVAMSLARAEEYALFEHRDLHLGNVCIRSTRPDGGMHPPSDSEIMRQSYSSGFGLSTLQTTLIDYSLSRAELALDDEASELLEITSSDLDKKQIFDAIGEDEDDALLRDTYRHMRAQLYKGNPVDSEKTPDIPGIWAEYAPRTNLIWLRFLLKMLLKNRKPEAPENSTHNRRQPLAPCSSNKEIKKATKSSKKKHDAPSKINRSSDVHAKIADLKQTLEDRLVAVLELLDLEHGHDDMCCSADLVAFAIDAQWLDERDFFSAE